MTTQSGNGKAGVEGVPASLLRALRFREERARKLPVQIETAKQLWAVAQSDTGQSQVVARFLLGLYNGYRFPFDLTEFRRLDTDLFEMCLQVLEMDATPEREIHDAMGIPGEAFERLARDWGWV
jgi:hypothetical protein